MIKVRLHGNDEDARRKLNRTDLITYALVVNSLARHRNRQRSSDPPLTEAA